MRLTMKVNTVNAVRLLSVAVAVLALGLATVQAQQGTLPTAMAGTNGTKIAVPPPVKVTVAEADKAKAADAAVQTDATSQSAGIKGLNMTPGIAPQPFAKAIEGKAAPDPAKPAKAGDEGLKVHGYWVIDIKNPDGTVAEHREFENSLQFGGMAYLIGLMGGFTVPADYEIFLQGNGSNSPCLGPSLDGCVIVRSLTTSPGSNSCAYYLCSLGLAYTYNMNYSTNANSFVLTGSATANRAGTIAAVSTYAGSCPIQYIGVPASTVSPANCQSQAGGIGVSALTGALITPVSVANGQIIQVTVTISFS